MCENKVTNMALDSVTSAYGFVVSMCDGMSWLSGLESPTSRMETPSFDEKYDILKELFQEDGQKEGRRGAFSSYCIAALKNSSSHTNEQVFVKCINRLILPKTDEELIRSEGRITRTLYHKNILSCFDFFEEPATYYIIYEKVEGGSLFQRLAVRKTLSEKMIRDIFDSLLSAVKYCHEKNVVHRLKCKLSIKIFPFVDVRCFNAQEYYSRCVKA
jgi:serine/threonine protein kinase